MQVPHLRSDVQRERSCQVETPRGRDSKFFTCPNGHPYPVDNCEWPTVVGRCLDCREMIGGYDHKLLSTNWRISKTDHEWLIAQLPEMARNGGSVETLLAKVQRIPIPDHKTIDPDEFDPTTLKLKKADVIAMNSDRVDALELPFSLPRRHCASELPGPGRAVLTESGRKLIVCFGDSLTEGLSRWDQPFLPYSSKLEQLLMRNADGRTTSLVVNAGVRGETTKEMCIRLRSILHEYDGLLEMVLILGGTNDLVETPAWITVENLMQLHKMAHAAGARTVALTVPDCTKGANQLTTRHYEKELKEINDKLRCFAMQNPESTLLADVAAVFPQDWDHTELWESDGVHFSAKGYEALGELLAKELLAHADVRGRLIAAPLAPAKETDKSYGGELV